METNKKISISIVTYNSKNDVSDVLNSINNSINFKNLEVYVIDNCSTDGTVEYIEKQYPFVNVIHSDKNGGYGYGHNKVLQKLKSNIHIVVNPDMKFAEDVIDKVESYMCEHKDVVLCTPEMISDGGEFVLPPKANPRVHYLIGRFFPKIAFFQKWRDEYSYKKIVCSKKNVPFDIEFCSGAFMALRTDVFKSVNGFDDRYFLYFEDADLTRKVSEFGKCVCLPNVYIYHEGKRAAHTSNFARKIMITSMIKYFNKWGWKL